MKFNTKDDLIKYKCKGFKTFYELMRDQSSIPEDKGIYFVLYFGEGKPEFRETGTGGHYNGKDPNVSLEKLNNAWVENTIVLYIGQAGGNCSQETLNSRITTYLQFGQEKKVAHRGGRYIWQIENSDELVICWKKLKKLNPSYLEWKKIKEFIERYKKRPFANRNTPGKPLCKNICRFLKQ